MCMNLTIGERKYRSNGFFGIVGWILMMPAFTLMFIGMILIFMLATPGFLIGMIGAKRIY